MRLPPCLGIKCYRKEIGHNVGVMKFERRSNYKHPFFSKVYTAASEVCRFLVLASVNEPVEYTRTSIKWAPSNLLRYIINRKTTYNFSRYAFHDLKAPRVCRCTPLCFLVNADCASQEHEGIRSSSIVIKGVRHILHLVMQIAKISTGQMDVCRTLRYCLHH